ncbi:ESPR-type extended signal peptide-containing protein, partial [Acinetobacter higginsii]|uniref:ESPR-type extended signal peptide-containing protein n=1 Tax=Acinetobacter higginsii TaxID=70347 RepID=UPI001F613069
MNKIYRLVWNKYLGLWTVVSELARGTTKKRNVSVTSTVAACSLPPLNSNLLYTQSLFKPILLATVMSSIFYSSQAFAGYELNGGSTFTNCTSASTGSGTESTNSLAFGPNACAPTNDSIAIGRAASTQSVGGVSNQSISIGAFSRAGGDQSVALGANTRATGNSSVAIGGDDVDRLANDAALRAKYNQITGGTIVAGQYPTTTAMQGSTAVGVQANATGDFSSAYGMTSKATGDASAAFGVQANATGLGAVAFGAVAQATGNGSAALGVNATASANNATAIGSGNSKAVAARATAVGATAVGNLSLASGVGAAAIGRNTRASGDRSIALGDGSQSTANGTAAFGVNANASADKAIAIGSGETPDTAAKASAVDATAIGNRSVSSGVGSAAIGRAAQATGDKSLALGDAAQAVTSGDMAVGDTSYARSGAGNISAIALGRNSKADGNNTLAIGNAAQATDNFAAAIGNSAEASADNSIAVGNSAKAAGNFSSALGNTANASGLEASAVGNSATASGDYALATGSRAQALALETVAIGHAATAQGSGDIAIGSDAKTALGNSNNIAVGNKVTTGATGQNVALGSSGTTANSESAEGGAVAIGRDQVANGDGAVAIGDPNRASGSGAVALGKDNTAAGDTGATTLASGAVAIGNTNQAIGQGSVAIGNTSNAAAAGAIALGDTAVANGGQSVSIGSNSQAVRAGDIAVGAGAYAAAKVVNGVPESAAAFGLQARADGATTLAVGNSAQATADYAGALGNAAEATSIEATAVGNRAKATNEYSTAVGTNATASGLQSTATGNRAQATGDFSLAQGNNTQASGLYSTAVGNFSTATGESAVAIGDLANATETDTIAIGTRTAASGPNSNAIGIDAKATGSAAVALGAGAEATADNALATGVASKAMGASAIATGDNAQAQGDNDIAMGRNAATATGGTNNIAMGNGVSTGATGQNVAIGSDGTTANSETATGGAVAIGRAQTATGDGAVAIGDPNHASGSGAVALGKDNTAAGDTGATTLASGAVAIGNTNQAIGQGSVAIGNTSNAAAAGAIALGDTANAQAERGIALGSNAVASNADDVALGSGSVTSAANPTANGTVGGVTYNYAGISPSSVVSVGSAGNERQITNVAAGRVSETSTDAINGSQLYSTQQALGNLAESTANHLGGGSTVNPDGSITAPSYIVNETPINNVGAAIEALDQGWNLQTNGAGADAIKAGDTVDIGTVAGEENLTVTKNGNTIQYGLNRNLKVDSVTAGDTVINTDGMTITNGPSITKSGINAAGNPMTNVGAGVADTDAVNKSQLDAATAAGKNTVSEGKNITVTESSNADGSTNYQVATADNVEFNNVAVGDVTIDGKTGKISGVTAGDVSATSTDAINGSQLAGTAKSVSDALGGGSTVNPDGTVTAPSYEVNGETVRNVGDAIEQLDQGWNLQSNGAKAGAVKAGDTVDIGTVNGEENLTVTKDGNTIQYGLNKNLRVDSVRAGDTLVNDNGVTITNGPSITKSGINAAGNPISNVGAGVNDSDAVNKGQLDDAAAAAKTEVTQGKNITVSKTTGADGQDIYNVATADNVEFNNVTVGDVTIDGTTGKISGVTAGEVSATSDEAINGSQLAGTAKSVSDALGGGSVVNPDGTVTAPSYTVNGNNVSNVGAAISELDKGWNLQSNGANAGAIKAGDMVDIGTVNGEENLTVTKDGNTIQYGLNKDLKVDRVTAGDTVINTDGVTISNGPSITKSGINAAGNPISNVGAGVNDTDAVNKGQLDDVAAAAKTEVTQGKNITVSKTTGAKGQDIYNVATADNVEFNNVQVGDVTIDGSTGNISGVTAGDVSATSTDAINGSQLAGTAKSVSDALGGGSTVNPDGTVTAPSYEVNGETVRNVGDAIEQLDQGWNLQSNGAKAGAVKAGDTVDIGTVNGEENLTVTKDGNTIQYGLNKDLKVDRVTAGDTVINTDGVTISNGPSITKSGINAAGNKITNVAPGTAGTDAVNKSQLDATTAASKNTVSEGKNITITESSNADGSTNYEVATADNVDFNNVTVGGPNGINIDGTTGKISGVADGSVAAGSKDAVNGGQLNDSVVSTGDILGGGVTNEGGKLNGPFTVSGKGYDTVADAIQGEAAASKTEVTEGKNVTVTKTTGADGQDIYNVATKDDVSFDSVQVGDVNIDGATGKISGVADGTVAAGSTDAINGSQLAGTAKSVSDALGGGSVVNPDGTVTAPSYTVNGNNVTNVGAAISELDKGWNLQSNSANAGAIKAGDTVDIGTVNGEENLTVSKEGKTIQYGLNKDLKVNSVTAGDTVINTDGVTISNGPSITKSGINAAGNPITNVGAGVDDTDAVNKGQLDDAAAASKTEVTEGKNVTVTKATGADGQDIYNVATKDDVSFDSVQVGDVNIDAATGKISGVADGTIAAGSKDAINGGQLNDSIASTGDILGGGVTNEGGKLNGPFTVSGKGYDTVADAIQGEAAAAKTEVTEGKNVTVTKTTGADGQDIYNVATKDDVSFDSVQVGDVNIDGVTGKISGVADGTVVAGSKEAVNGGQLHGVADSVRNSIGGETTLNPDGSITTSNVGNTGQNNIHDAIDSVRGQAVAAKTTVTEGDNMVVTQSKNADGSTNYEVATAKDVKFDSVTATDADGNETILDAKGVSLKDQAGNTTILGQDGLGFADPMGNSVGPRISARGIDAGNTVITGVAPGRIAADSTDAINGSQLKGVADSVSNAIGGNTTVNPDGTIVTKDIGGTGKDNINDAIGAVGKAAQAAKTTVSKADGDENVTVTSRPNDEGGTDFQVGLSKDIKVDSVTAGDTVINGDGLTIAGGPSVTKDGIDAGDNKVTGVADGTIAAGSKDAINGGQLHGVADSVKNVV